jgi:hypothetical protein
MPQKPALALHKCGQLLTLYISTRVNYTKVEIYVSVLSIVQTQQ